MEINWVSKHHPFLVHSTDWEWWLIKTRRLPFAMWDVYRKTQVPYPGGPPIERYAGGFWSKRAATQWAQRRHDEELQSCEWKRMTGEAPGAAPLPPVRAGEPSQPRGAE